MKHMLMGRMSCLWAPRHKEAPMLITNIGIQTPLQLNPIAEVRNLAHLIEQPYILISVCYLLSRVE